MRTFKWLLIGPALCVSLAALGENRVQQKTTVALERARSSVEQPGEKLHFSVQPADAEIASARVFDEPLVPVNATELAGENQALAQALTGYAQRSTYDDCSGLAQFADQFPQSRWTPSLLF